ncbi:MAG: hypothetical protein AB8G11_13065 [Saprospiraceae bacterium]
MKNLLLIIITCFPILLSAQITFDKGYFIKNNGEKVECFIYNEDWKNHPTEIEYRMVEGGTVEIVTVKDIQEFSIYGISKYVRYKGKVDISGNTASRYSEQKEPEWEERTIFLKPLIEGSATLYYYNSKQIARFYYKMENGEIEPLIYKKYLLNRTGVKLSAINAKFRRQLLVSMQCETMSMEDVDKLEYNEKSLKNYFVKYHQCLGEEPIVSEPQKYSFNLGIKAGMGLQKFQYSGLSIFNWETSGLNPRFGIEAEFVLPFNKNKWAIVVEPTYQMMNKTEAVNFDVFPNTLTREFDLDYQSIELQAGFRHYFFLNKDSKLFANLLYVKDFDLNSTLTHTSVLSGISQVIDLYTTANWALGFGYKYKDLAAVELRYNTYRTLTAGYGGISTAYRNISLSLTYDLF